MRQAEAHPVGLIIRLQRLTQPPGVTHSGCRTDAKRHLSPVPGTEFVKYAPNVKLDRALTQLELARNFLVGFSICQWGGNFVLPWRETLSRRRSAPEVGGEVAFSPRSALSQGYKFARYDEWQGMLKHARPRGEREVASRAVAE